MSNKHRNYNAMSSKPKEPTQYKPKEETLVKEGNVVNDNPSYEAPINGSVTNGEAEGKFIPATADGPVVDDGVKTNNPEPPKATFGVVSNCLRLNVRELPNKRSDVVTIIDAGDEVAIDLDKSTDGWYCVGSGYVMKEFITIK